MRVSSPKRGNSDLSLEEASTAIDQLSESNALNQENLNDICLYLFSDNRHLDVRLLRPSSKFFKSLINNFADRDASAPLLQYYLLQFVNVKRVSGESKCIAYADLLQSYLNYFYPPIGCLENIYTDRSTDFSGGRSLQTLCEFLIQTMSTQYTDLTSPTLHKCACVHVLVRHFSSRLDPRLGVGEAHGSVAGMETTFEQTKVVALSFLLPSLYTYFRVGVSTIGSGNPSIYLSVVNTWIRWLTPWGSTDTPDLSWNQYIRDNLPFYTSILGHFISTPTQFNKLCTPSTISTMNSSTTSTHARAKAQLEAYDRVLCLFTETRNLRDILVTVEESMLEHQQDPSFLFPFVSGYEYTPVMMPDGGGVRNYVCLAITQLTNSITYLGASSSVFTPLSGDAVPSTSSFPSKPFEGIMSDWVLWVIQCMLTALKITLAYTSSALRGGVFGQDSGASRQELLARMKSVVVLMGCIWWEVSPVVGEFAHDHQPLGVYQRRRTPFGAVAGNDKFDIVGDRVVVMSYENEVLVHSTLRLEKWVQGRLGISRVRFRWFADVRNVGMIVLILVGLGVWWSVLRDAGNQ